MLHSLATTKLVKRQSKSTLVRISRHVQASTRVTLNSMRQSNVPKDIVECCAACATERTDGAGSILINAIIAVTRNGTEILKS